MTDWNWEDEILAKIPSGVDPTQITERLKLTPTERLERMRLFMEQLERARGQSADRIQKPR